MSEKLRQLLKDFVYYGKAGHLARAIEIANEIELQADREAREKPTVDELLS